jgi:hypothetical protein
VKKLIFVTLVVVISLFAPVITEASEYLGDFCWTGGNGNILLSFSVSFISLDSSGYEMYDYAGRMILTTGTAPVNGNCIEVKTAQKHIYACNLLMTSGDGAATFYAEFDYDTLVGTSSAIFNIYNGSSLSDQFVYPISLTPVPCPKW